MTHPEPNSPPCPAGNTSGHTEMLTGAVPQSCSAGAISSARDWTENLCTSWEAAWIDIGGEG
jgi:hypothetical protein